MKTTFKKFKLRNPWLVTSFLEYGYWPAGQFLKSRLTGAVHLSHFTVLKVLRSCRFSLPACEASKKDTTAPWFRNLQFTRGFSLAELMISLAILSVLIITVSTFQKDIFSLNFTLQSSLNAQLDGRHLVKVMVAELRKTTQSSTGSYAIELASSTGVTFYSDVDDNGSIDKVRYFLNGKVITKGVIIPTGNPLIYNPANEVLTTIINNIVASSTLPIFQYYPSNYTGSTVPLTQPVNVSSVRLVKINLIIDSDPNRSPVPIIITSQVSLRNLKDNL